MKGPSVQRWLPWLVLGLATVMSFGPVLRGTFLFDDFANLTSLGQYGPVDNGAALARYLSAGIADPIGRPVAMASFLLDASDWPAEPEPFLRTNLGLHLFNALLLTSILLRLGKHLDIPDRLRRNAALLGAMFWALHPLWVSTVGYIVQRHALMSTTFVFLGILAWAAGITALRGHQQSRGLIWLFLVVPGLGLLAALSKANGMLLPLLLLVLHYFILSRGPEKSRLEKPAIILLLILPSLLLLAALAATLDPYPAARPWSLAERLMSQPRILWDYLAHIVIPRIDSPGIFGDSIAVSTGWLDPRTTLPAMIALLGLACTPFVLRARWPVTAAALAFFLAAHVLESTVVPLELYFEHRNYLPAALLGWPLALFLLSAPIRPPLKAGVALVLLLILGLLTHARATLWADGPRQAEVWASTLPDSPRAQTWKAQYDLEAGQLADARLRLRKTLDANPGNPMLALNLLDVECVAGKPSDAAIRDAMVSVAGRGVGMDVTHVWLRAKLLGTAKYCAGLDRGVLRKLLDSAEPASRVSPEGTSRFLRLDAMFAIGSRDCPRASILLQEAINLRHRDKEAFADAALLASHCGPRTASQYLDVYLGSSMPDLPPPPGMQRIHHWVLLSQNYWRSELVRLHRILASELSESPPGGDKGVRR